MTDYNDPTVPQDGPEPTPTPAGGEPTVSSASAEATATSTAIPPSAPPKKGKAGRVALVALGVVAIGGGGAFAFTQLTGGEKANTPEQAVEGFYRSFERGDFVGMSKALAPGERDVFLDSIVPLASEMSRLEILEKDFTFDKVKGVNATLSNYKATSKPLRADLAAVTVTGGKLKATVNPKDFPFGDFLRDQFGKQIDEAEASTSTTDLRVGSGDSPLIVQKIGKRWYISGNYSIAEAARRDMDEPFKVPVKGGGVAAKGAKTPELAVSEMLQASANLDVRRVIELLPPDEFAALHDYAGEFIDDAEKGVADTRKQYTFTVTPKLAVSDLASDRRLVTILDMPMSFRSEINGQKIAIDYKNKGGTASFTSKDGEDLRAEYKGNCATVKLDGETKKGCGRDGIAKLFTDITGTPLDLSQLPATTGGVKGPCGTARKAKLGFTVIKRDGLWYVSPLRTMFDGMTAAMKTLDRSTLDCLVKEVRKLVDSSSNNNSSVFQDGTGEDATIDSTFDTVADTLPVFNDDPIAQTPACIEVNTREAAGDTVPSDLYDQCFSEAMGDVSASPDTVAVDTSASS
jgi:hypothetical protein